MFEISNTVVFSQTILDAGYLLQRSGDPGLAGMLDILEFAGSRI